MFSNHFTTNFSQNVPVKKIENRSIFGKDMDKTLWLTFWAIHSLRNVQLFLLSQGKTTRLGRR